MVVILDNEFATAKDTAAALGVSATRLKRLIRLAGPKAPTATFAMKRSGRSATNGKMKRATTVRRKQTRAKTKKAAH